MFGSSLLVNVGYSWGSVLSVFMVHFYRPLDFPGGSVVKNLPANEGAAGDVGSIQGAGRFPGGGNGNPLQYSCLENPRDGGAWWAAVYGVAQSLTRLK